MRTPLIAAVAALVILPWGTPLAAAPSPTPASTVDKARLAKVGELLEDQRKQLHIPGLAFAVVKDDEVILLDAFGLRDVDRQLPATVDTVFPIGSCTKAFTSMAAGISQDEGVLSLDDSPHRYLPYFKLGDPEADALVTLRDMLSHRTGLKSYADLAAEFGVLTREEYLRAALSAKPAARLRAEFQYSNAMYTAAGELIARANHSTWERVIQTRIFDALGMKSSFTSALHVKAEDHALGYVYDEGARTWKAVPTPESLEVLAPAGSMASTARDMTQWLRLLTGGGSIEGKRLVTEETLRDLTHPHIRGNAAWSYALGWTSYDWNGHRVVEHNGGSQGISALVSFIPERRVGFVLLANTSHTWLTRIGNAGSLLWPVLLDETPPPASTPPPATPSAAEKPGATPTMAGDLPPVDELLERMVQAAGGVRNLQRHTSMKARAQRSYENQGVRSDVTLLAKAPAMRVEDEVFTALGKRLGRVRVFFDGAHGGQQTTFGQDSTNGAAEDERARRDATLYPLLDLRRLYKDITLQKRSRVGEEDMYVLQLTASDGSTVVLHVSARTGLVLRREANGESTTYEDYRNVDGEVVPFRTTARGALGEVTTQVQEVRFNVDLPDTAFTAADAAGFRSKGKPAP
ncbi:serine hydrolase [Archangium sp.]|uniref:serine hydrolase n=1 Tax=Archangium sp. TaxID=1872627 RepID=UPI00389B0276